ncbi:uncharacterized protein LOC119642752 [Glossina fuscipes]|uniref:Uncharacterized protein LOC119642752 n=1 Tax=Glossina fuscipes TaxID=7396 RepID=A0A9C5ZA69_9MUSC|nr:uncharacterized protein LOC119642752 [Glossina fuscipes]KAI9576125.1 hypothetical protein GQX74_014608 [Glossina fuscipes]
MFSSTNFLFLLSLGFISWIILCYFKQIEYHFMQKTVEAGDGTESLLGSSDDVLAVSPSLTCHENYETYVSFLCIFVCIYVLAKVTVITERYIAKNMRTTYRMPDIEEYELEFLDMENVEDLREQQETLLAKVDALEKQNLELKNLLKSETESNQTGNKASEENSLGLQNIYISNRHFHVNRHVFVKKKNVTMKFDKFAEKGDSVNIWEKYLDMQQTLSAKKISLTQTNLNHLAAQGPVIISTEDLEKIQGWF